MKVCEGSGDFVNFWEFSVAFVKFSKKNRLNFGIFVNNLKIFIKHFKFSVNFGKSSNFLLIFKDFYETSGIFVRIRRTSSNFKFSENILKLQSEFTIFHEFPAPPTHINHTIFLLFFDTIYEKKAKNCNKRKFSSIKNRYVFSFLFVEPTKVKYHARIL